MVGTPHPAASGMDPEVVARIPRRMQDFVDEGTLAGAVTLVARHGSIAALDAIGYRDIGHKDPMRIDTIFQIRSMTKPFTAVGVMILEETGVLTLDDPVEIHLPEFGALRVGTTVPGRASAPGMASRPITSQLPPSALGGRLNRKLQRVPGYLQGEMG